MIWLASSLMAAGCSPTKVEIATTDFCQVAREVDLPFVYKQAEVDARAGYATNLRKELALNKAEKELCPPEPEPSSP